VSTFICLRRKHLLGSRPLWISVPKKDKISTSKHAFFPGPNSPSDATPMNSFWRFCLARFEKELPPQQYKTWIKPLRFQADGDRLTLIAPNRFVLQWIRDKFLARIGELAHEQLKRKIDVQLALDESGEPPSLPPRAQQQPEKDRGAKASSREVS